MSKGHYLETSFHHSKKLFLNAKSGVITPLEISVNGFGIGDQAQFEIGEVQIETQIEWIYYQASKQKGLQIQSGTTTHAQLALSGEVWKIFSGFEYGQQSSKQLTQTQTMLFLGLELKI